MNDYISSKTKADITWHVLYWYLWKVAHAGIIYMYIAFDQAQQSWRWQTNYPNKVGTDVGVLFNYTLAMRNESTTSYSWVEYLVL